MSKNGTLDRIANQGIAAYVSYINKLRYETLLKELNDILDGRRESLIDIARREGNATDYLDNAIERINEINPNRGKVHGFYAEEMEAGITNARRAYDGIRKSVSVLGDNGRVDLRVGQHDVQVKFYKNLLAELKTATEYRDMNMMYSKDHYEIYRRIMNGENDIVFNGEKLSLQRIESIRNRIIEESEARGKPFYKWMEPSKVDYDDVQKRAARRTVENEKLEIQRKADDANKEVNEKATTDASEAFQEAKPSFEEATQAAGVAMAVQGGINFGMYVYEQHKQGKEIWQFDADNWKQAGIQTGKGVLKGGISGYSIYYLTNACQLSAPSAGAIASGTFGIANAVISHRTGELDDDGFIDAIIFNAIDSTGAAAGAAIGQVLIPIPVVGAVVGSIVASTALSLGKGILNRQEEALIKEYENNISAYIKILDAEYEEKYDQLMKQYKAFGEIQNRAFDLDTNVKLRFDASIEMAQMLGVEEGKILHDIYEVDSFFM